MIASCQRRLGNTEKSLKIYQEIHTEDPENLESLKFIVQLSQELNIPYDNYLQKLKKLERSLEAMEGGFVDLNNTLERKNNQGNIKIQNNNQRPLSQSMLNN